VGEDRPDDRTPPTFRGINNFTTNRIEDADDQCRSYHLAARAEVTHLGPEVTGDRPVSEGGEMNIALLAPIAPSAANDGGAEVVFRLAEGLVARGAVVTLFGPDTAPTVARRGAVDLPAGAPPAVWESLLAAGCFEQGDDFDLIHSHAGTLPLTHTRATATPVVTTLRTPPTAATLPLLQRYNGEVHYVTTDDAVRHPSLTYAATIADGDAPMVDTYLALYERIIRLAAREDHRPWGSYYVYADRPDHKVKRIVVLPNKRLSLQLHHHRQEHWLVVAGHGIVTRDEERIAVGPGEAVDLPREARHRVENPGDVPLVFVEVQLGDYFGEDDIVRFEDDFGRAGTTSPDGK